MHFNFKSGIILILKYRTTQKSPFSSENLLLSAFSEDIGEPPGMKKALKIIKNTFVWLVIALAVFMMIFTVVSVTTFNRNDRDLFGYKAYIVNTDSMAKTDFNAGDLIFVKEVDPSTLNEGDIITYISQNTESFGETITHKIRRRTTDAEGNPGFITYGTTTDTDDTTVVTYPYILGK